jgi:hypothetical protein
VSQHFPNRSHPKLLFILNEDEPISTWRRKCEVLILAAYEGLCLAVTAFIRVVNAASTPSPDEADVSKYRNPLEMAHD